MLLSEQAYEEFREIYKKKYGETISFNEAISKGDSLIRYLQSIHKIQLKGYDRNHARK